MSFGIDLSGRVAVVTGGRRGIGAAIAEALSDCGAKVVVTGRQQNQTRPTRAGQVPDGVFEGDLLRAEDRERLLGTAGRVDILVNNAGGFVHATTTQDCAPDDWDAQLKVNLTLPFLMCQAVLPGMVERGWGRIVNIGSVVASAPQLGNAIGYVAAKAGLAGFTRQLAAEVAANGVTVNLVNPGTVHTEHLDDYFHNSSSVTAESLARHIAIGRLGRPEEIAGVVPYLASELGAFITGAALDINGGAISA